MISIGFWCVVFQVCTHACVLWRFWIILALATLGAFGVQGAQRVLLKVIATIIKIHVPIVGAHVHWTTVRLVLEALPHNLHVVEDLEMIDLLGCVKVVDLVINGRLGWQKEVSLSLLAQNQTYNLRIRLCAQIQAYRHYSHTTKITHFKLPFHSDDKQLHRISLSTIFPLTNHKFQGSESDSYGFIPYYYDLKHFTWVLRMAESITEVQSF